MATIDELSVAIGADLGNFDRGLAAAVSKVGVFGNDITKAADGAAKSFDGLSIAAERAANGGIAASDKAAGRFLDKAGKLHEANGRFVSSATLAAEAAGNFGGALAKASINFSRFEAASGKLKDAGGGLTAGVTTPIVATGVAALVSAAKLEALRLGLQSVAETELTAAGVAPLEATARAATETTARLKELEEIAKLPGLGFEDAVEGDLRLRGAGLSAKQSAKSLQEFGNALARAGKGKNELNSVTLALSQIATKGKVSQEEINQLTEAGIVLGPVLKKAFGTADTEALQKAGIDATKFINGVTAELGKLPRVAGGLQNSFETIGDTISKSFGIIGDKLNKAFNVQGVVERVGTFIEGLANSFAALDPATQKTVFALVGLAAGVGPVIFAVGALGAALPALIGGLTTVGAAVGLAAGPFALLIGAVGLAAVAIVSNWDEIVSYFNGPDGRVFQELGRAVGESIDGIKAAFSELNNSTSFGDLFSAGNILQDLIKSIGTGFVSVLDVVNGVVRAVSGLLEGDWSRAFDGAKQAVNGLLGPLANLFGLDYASLREKLGVLGDAPLELGDAPLEGASVLTNPFIELNKGLDGYLQQVPAAIASTNGLAAASKAAIGITEEQSKALQKLRANLQEAGDLSNVLGRDQGLQEIGSEYDFVQAKIKALEGAIPGLVAAFGSQAGVVKNTAAELFRLKNAYDDLGKLDKAKLLAGLAEFKPFVAAEIKVNPLDTTATQQIQQQLARLGLQVPPLDLTQFGASAAQLESIAASLSGLPDVGRLDITGPVESVEELRAALTSLTGIDIAALPSVPALDISAPITNLSELQQQLSTLTGIAIAELPDLTGLDVSLPIGNLSELRAALAAVPQAATLAPVPGLDITAPLTSLDELRAKLDAVGAVVLPPAEGLSVRGPITNLQELESALSRLSGIAAVDLPPVAGVDVREPIRSLEQLRVALLGFPELQVLLPPVNSGALEASVNASIFTLARLPAAVAGLELPPLPPLPAFDTGIYEDSLIKLSDAQRQALSVQTQFNTDFEALIDQLPNSIGAALADAAEVFATSFGQIIAGTVSAGSGLQAAFQGTLGIIAQFAGDFGKQLVALGTAKVIAESFALVPGPGIIAAGLALIAAAGVTKALISKGPKFSGGGAIAGGGLSGGGISTPRQQTPTTAPQLAAAPSVVTYVVEVKMAGRDLVGVLEYQTDRQGRVVGRR